MNIRKSQTRSFNPIMVVLEIIAWIGQWSIHAVMSLGDFGCFFGSIIYGMFTGMNRRTIRELFIQMYEMGTLSIPVVLLGGGFIGAVLAVETYPQFKDIGVANRIGAVIVISVVKQIGPVLTAVMLAGRLGGSMTAELGTMNVTEQIDALRVMAADPVRTLVVPRVLACVIMTPVLTVFSDAIGILGGWFICVVVEGVRNYPFWHYAQAGMNMFTIYQGLIKAFFFGIVISAIACYKGFRCGNGAQGVGRACTESFVTGFCVILLANFILAVLLTNISIMLWPNQPGVL
jgi:phospholipid/cholesterol/gamma-HCH transport system permease protein